MTFKTLRVKCMLCGKDGYDGNFDGFRLYGLTVQEIREMLDFAEANGYEQIKEEK